MRKGAGVLKILVVTSKEFVGSKSAGIGLIGYFDLSSVEGIVSKICNCCDYTCLVMYVFRISHVVESTSVSDVLKNPEHSPTLRLAVSLMPPSPTRLGGSSSNCDGNVPRLI